MKRTLVALVILANLAITTSAQRQPPGPKNIEAEVLAAIHGRLDAVSRNDTAAWANFVDDNMVGPLGGSKQGWMKMHAAFPREVKYWYGPLENVNVRIHGDTAIVVFQAKQFNDIGGQTTFTTRWQTETHVRRNGRWLLAAIADCVIPREPVATKVDSAIYESYAGQYEWAPTLVSTITREGDKLREQFTGDENELLPENETTFFVKGEAILHESFS